MHLHLSVHMPVPDMDVQLTGSKSLTNRYLILSALHGQISLSNQSDSDDSQVMRLALSSNQSVVDVHHAGTAMRFLTAYFAGQAGRQVMLTGSQRLKQRPIGPLVDALRELGARIEYVDKEGFPPLRITGTTFKTDRCSVDASQSSQFVTALILIGSSLPQGLHINLMGHSASQSYLSLTADCIHQVGGQVRITNKELQVESFKLTSETAVAVESDWSSAGYWYEWVALSPRGTTIELSTLYLESAQGDKELAEIFTNFGVETNSIDEGSLLITKTSTSYQQHLSLDLKNQPDQAQTIFCTCLALGIEVLLTGLHTLRIKETDRIAALKQEGMRFRESVNEIITTPDTIQLKCDKLKPHKHSIYIDTYNDHRMALAFAPLALKCPIVIKNAEVVTKSYPNYWKDLERAGAQIQAVDD